MNANSNQLSFLVKAGAYPCTKIPSGTIVNTITTLFTGPANAGLITDVLFRNNAQVIVNLNLLIVPSGQTGGSAGTPYAGPYLITTLQIPAGAGSNGSTPLASLAGMVPQLFDLDLAGNRVFLTEAGDTLFVQNTSALASDINVMVKARTF